MIKLFKIVNGIDIGNDEIETWIKNGVSYLDSNKNDEYYYTLKGNKLVFFDGKIKKIFISERIIEGFINLHNGYDKDIDELFKTDEINNKFNSLYDLNSIKNDIIKVINEYLHLVEIKNTIYYKIIYNDILIIISYLFEMYEKSYYTVEICKIIEKRNE